MNDSETRNVLRDIASNYFTLAQTTDTEAEATDKISNELKAMMSAGLVFVYEYKRLKFNDFISKIEEFYISELESINTYRKTKPKDLIYLDKLPEKKESLFKKNLSSFFEGFNDSKYHRGF